MKVKSNLEKILFRINNKLKNNFIFRLYKPMFKEIQLGFEKFVGKRWIPLIIIIAICAILMYYSSSKSNVFDRMTTSDTNAGKSNQPSQYAGPVQPVAQSAPSVSAGASGYSSQPVANPSDLLPHDQNSQWANLNPIGNGVVAMPDLLQAGAHIGLDTIGQTLKNANLQLRSDPIIEKKDIGPWNQSTYEADYGRVPLEVGYGQR